MSLFGARTKSTFQKVKERLEKMQEAGKVEGSTPEASTGSEESSHIGQQLEIQRALQDSKGTATTSEIAREGNEEEQIEAQTEAVTLPREVFNAAVRIHNADAREWGRLSKDIEPVWGPAKCDEYGQRLSQQAEVHVISSDDGSSLSPPPTTSYEGSNISFPVRTQSMKYEGSIVAFPRSALPEDPISNKPSFRQKHPGVSDGPDGPDGSDGTSYPLTENQMRPIAQAMGHVASLPCGGYYTMPLILIALYIMLAAPASGFLHFESGMW